jgi:predicted TIM-barrel fold metal-dependent hydrolase
MLLSDLTPIPVVDSHVHVFPDRLAQAVRSWFSRYAWEFHEKGTTEELLERLFQAGLHSAVLLTYAHRPGISDELNRFVASMVNRFPRAVGLATVHPQDKHVKGILKRAFAELNLKGVKLHCHVQLVAPDDPALDPVYEAASDWGFPVTIHAGKEPYVPAYGMDVRRITGAQRVERVLKRFPELRLIVPHLGFDESEQFYKLLEAHPYLYLDTTMMLAGFFPVPVERGPLLRYSERLLYGTDYPHIPYQVDLELKSLLALELGEIPTRKILWENARDLFGILPPAGTTKYGLK